MQEQEKADAAEDRGRQEKQLQRRAAELGYEVKKIEPTSKEPAPEEPVGSA